MAKEEIETYEVKPKKIIKNMDWFLFLVALIILILGAIESNKVLLLIGVLGFILLLLKIIYIAAMNK